jgi:hypothetical protein
LAYEADHLGRPSTSPVSPISPRSAQSNGLSDIGAQVADHGQSVFGTDLADMDTRDLEIPKLHPLGT